MHQAEKHSNLNTTIYSLIFPFLEQLEQTCTKSYTPTEFFKQVKIFTMKCNISPIDPRGIKWHKVLRTQKEMHWTSTTTSNLNH